MKTKASCISILFVISCFSAFGNLDSLFTINEKKLNDSIASVHLREIAMAYYYEKGDLDSALVFMEKSLLRAEKRKSNFLIAKSKNGIGLMYREKGIYDRSLENYLQGLKFAEKLNDTSLITSSLMGIGVVHHIQKNYELAKENYDKCFLLNTLSKNSAGLQSYYNNTGLLFFHQQKYDSALHYYDEGKNIAIQMNDERGFAICNENIGLIHLYDLRNYAEAIENFNQSLSIWRKMGDVNSIAITLGYMSHALMESGKLNQAIDTAKLSISLAEQIGSLSAQRDAWELIHRIYDKKGDFKNALFSFKSYVKLKDSLMNNDMTREITSMQVRYDENKKRVRDSLAMSVQNVHEMEKKDLLLAQKSIQRNWILVGLVLVVVLALVIYFAYRNKQKANEVIEQQKKNVEERNREITDSIVYAKHIQDSILPDENSFHKIGLSGFVFYKPKDIVAGDFYWHSSFAEASDDDDNNKLTEPVEGNITLFAVGDCTGHGVPGALVSVMCNQAIKQAVREHSKQHPAFILDKVNDLVNDTFYSSNTMIYDGMDIAFCKWNRVENKLFFAGANNTIVIIRNNEIIELKGDKQPIGKHPARRNFTPQELQLKANDMLYLFSDGFSDQFGGEKRKKLKYTQFKHILQKASLLAVEKQKEFLQNEFENWRGQLEQVDDVCVLGLRV